MGSDRGFEECCLDQIAFYRIRLVLDRDSKLCSSEKNDKHPENMRK